MKHFDQESVTRPRKARRFIQSPPIQIGCTSKIPLYTAPMPATNKRVLLGMSGGVDSSVTAHLLKQQALTSSA
jgi:tRNA(Ile)-lysidine synthase TilS/MesJ